MPEPCPDSEGRYVRLMTGSRDFPVSVRVHRYVEGTLVRRPVDSGVARQAGLGLAAIQNIGVRSGLSAPMKQLWQTADDSLLRRFQRRWPDIGVDRGRVLHDAERIAAERAPGARPSPSHCDHKPENCLINDGVLHVLDWDEAGCCDPRIEVVESGLRWSWTAEGTPDPGLFASFARGYRAGGRPFPPLRERDWAKWIADLGSWYEFQARCSLGECSAVARAPGAAASAAAEALQGLARTLQHIPEWCAAINDRL